MCTIHHVARLQNIVNNNFNKNVATAMISLDCSNAFDSVSHNTLCTILQDLECPEQLHTLLRSFLSDRTISVKVGQDLSRQIRLTCGVPQGAVLSPVLFNIYTADVVGKTYPKSTVAAYADDIAVYSSSMNPSKALNQAEKTCQDIVMQLEHRNIQLNPPKTDAK